MAPTRSEQSIPAQSAAMRPRRRWLRFSLRTLLVGVTAIAVGLVLFLRWDARARRQREAVVTFTTFYKQSLAYEDGFDTKYKAPPIRKYLGVKFFHDHFHEVTEVDLDNSNDHELRLLASFPKIKTVALSWSAEKCTEEGLQPVFACKNLEELYFNEVPELGDRSLQAIGSLGKLRHINLSCRFRATSAGWEHLARLSKLESLRLDFWNPQTCSLKSLAALQSLQWLQVRFPLTDYYGDEEEPELLAADLPPGDLSFIGTLKKLKSLTISSKAALAPEFLAGLRGMPNLQQLELESTAALTDEALAELGQLRALKSLILKCPGGTTSDAGLARLAGMSQLQRMELPLGETMSDAGLRSLNSMPKLKRLIVALNERVTGDGIAQLTQLEYLELRGDGKGQGAGWQLRLPAQLKYAELAGVDLTDESLRTFTPGDELRELTFSFCQRITDAGLEHLQSATQLKVLQIHFCEQTTEVVVADLQKALPNCKVSALRGGGSFGMAASRFDAPLD